MSTENPSPERPPQPAGLDAQALERLRELDPQGKHGVVLKVLGAFETSLARMLGQLRAQQPQPQASVVSAVAHTLKSSAASVGALQLSKTCAEVESLIRTGQLATLDRDIGRLIADGESAMVAVRAILHP
jgi:HPt (histidine-containing phosphotransfer) domain-containing protein